MTKQKRVDASFDELDARLDAKAFFDLERTVPDIAAAITALVGLGVEPRAIKAHVLRHYPNLWPEAQRVEQAARHLEGQV